ncbi:MAG: hypothetical protein ACXABY_14735 [Candidatus Thorarchaeota archaeon]|jgi:hypothetical protein
MTWAVIPGSPHGGLPPAPVIDSISVDEVVSGDTVVIDGLNFFPDSKVFLDPGARFVTTVSPANTTQVTITIPYGLPNIKHKLYISNDQDSNKVDIFVTRSVMIDPTSTVDANIILSGAN